MLNDNGQVDRCARQWRREESAHRHTVGYIDSPRVKSLCIENVHAAQTHAFCIQSNLYSTNQGLMLTTTRVPGGSWRLT